MKSTGEAIGYDKTLEKALYKGLIASGIDIPHEGSVLLTVADKDKVEANYVGERFHNLGFDLFATSGTAKFLREKGLPVTEVEIGRASCRERVEIMVGREVVREKRQR